MHPPLDCKQKKVSKRAWIQSADLFNALAAGERKKSASYLPTEIPEGLQGNGDYPSADADPKLEIEDTSITLISGPRGTLQYSETHRYSREKARKKQPRTSARATPVINQLNALSSVPALNTSTNVTPAASTTSVLPCCRSMDIAIRIANEKALLPAANHAIFMKADWYPITAACETSVPLLQEATVSSPSKPADRKLAMNLMHLPTNAVTENDCQERFPDWTEPIHTVPVGSYESTKALLATDSGDVPCFDGATDVETFSDHDILRNAGPRSYEGNSLAKNVHAEFNADFNAIPTILGLSSPTAESLALKEDIEVLKNSCLTDCSTIEESLVDAQMSATFVQDVSSPITHAIDEALPGYFKDRISEESLSGVFLMSSRLPASRNLNPSLSRSKSIFSSEESSGSSRTTIASDLQLNDAVTTSSESLATFEVDRKPNNYFTRWSNQELECALLHENENLGNSSSHIDSEASSIVRDLTEVAITDTSSPPSICSRQSSSTLVSLESGIYSEPPENNELNSWGDGAQSEIMVEVDLEKTGKAAESVDTTPLKNVVEIHCWWKVICRGASLPLHHVRIEIGNGVVKIKFLITEMEEINFTLSNIRVQVPTSRKMWRSYSHRRLVIDGGQEQVELLASFPSDRDKLVKRIARYWRDQMLSRSKGTA